LFASPLDSVRIFARSLSTVSQNVGLESTMKERRYRPFTNVKTPSNVRRRLAAHHESDTRTKNNIYLALGTFDEGLCELEDALPFRFLGDRLLLHIAVVTFADLYI
jgi:hypothetical protein